MHLISGDQNSSYNILWTLLCICFEVKFIMVKKYIESVKVCSNTEWDNDDTVIKTIRWCLGFCCHDWKLYDRQAPRDERNEEES